MDEKMQGLKETYPNVETMTIVADISKLTTIDSYREIITDKLNDIDVGVVAVNAGILMQGPFKDLRDSEITNQIIVNGV